MNNITVLLVLVLVLDVTQSGTVQGHRRLLAIEDAVTDPEARIVGGQVAQDGQFPFQVSISVIEWDVPEHICGGSIISESFVVTAAQCVVNHVSNDLTVQAGEVSFSLSSGYEQQRSVNEITVHPEYDDITFANDIAIIRLGSPFTFGFGVNSIPLALIPEPQSNDCTTLGWGLTSEDGTAASNVLRYISVQAISDTECEASYPAGSIFRNVMICAQDTKNNGDFCQGDEGGALTCNGYLHGVVSWGYGCARNYPGVYTQVFHFREWITGVIS